MVKKFLKEENVNYSFLRKFFSIRQQMESMNYKFLLLLMINLMIFLLESAICTNFEIKLPFYTEN